MHNRLASVKSRKVVTAEEGKALDERGYGPDENYENTKNIH
jgi:hypothetical protein